MSARSYSKLISKDFELPEPRAPNPSNLYQMETLASGGPEGQLTLDLCAKFRNREILRSISVLWAYPDF